eukprot:m.47599 g.47599  ORF g.47599 m.47599 type:complete len:54 (-) comp47589_c0_seq4:361-522(-)
MCRQLASLIGPSAVPQCRTSAATLVARNLTLGPAAECESWNDLISAQIAFVFP